MARILRGDIRWADLNPVRGHEQAGRRPVLVLSHDVFNARSGTVIAMAITSQPQRAGFPLALELIAKDLPKRSWVKIGQVRTLSVERIGRKIAQATPEQTARIVEGLNEIIGE
jgi:mRNA interferase MazF